MKKHYLLSLLVTVLVSAGSLMAQSASEYDVKDSSVIPTKRLPQHNEFVNGTNNYPAKPRSQWEIGIKGGLSTVSGDVRSVLPTFGGGLHVRKALGYIFSLRLEYDYLTAKGLNYSGSQGYVRNAVLAPVYATNTSAPVIFYNYKTTIHELGLQGVVSLNNIRFHGSKSAVNFYGFGGVAGMVYSTNYNALNGSNTTYNYSGIASQTYANRKTALKALKNLLDDTYETKAETDPLQPKLSGKSFRPVIVFGGGVQFRLSKKLSLSLEDKITLSQTDLLDGQRWQENINTTPYTPGAVSLTRNNDAYNFLSAGLNISIGSKAVEPLWWKNPLDYAYSEIRNPRMMKIPKPVLQDADGDGVTDQFDSEPNTPSGCGVDSHGVSKDTDGDGVPDCKDKELITPTNCQPVDANGVGKCPDPECCKLVEQNLRSMAAGSNGGLCNMTPLPPVLFKKNSDALTAETKQILAASAIIIKNSPDCNVKVIAYPEFDKKSQQLSFRRVNAIINYLVEKQGISAARFTYSYESSGDTTDAVDMQGVPKN